MSVLCFGSLKGGVGKTSLSVNVAHAFAGRGCEILVIDLDPMGHATRFFRTGGDSVQRENKHSESKHSEGKHPEAKHYGESPLARLFLSRALKNLPARQSLIEAALSARIPFIEKVRDGLTLLPGGPELRHFLWGRGARLFRDYFPRLLEELDGSYDYIVIDTPPDLNVLTRNAIAASQLVVVPVDSSAMSIHGLESLVQSTAHIKGPLWAIVRTMVTRQAVRLQRLSTERMHERLSVTSDLGSDDDDDLDIANPRSFISLLERCETEKSQLENSAPTSARARVEQPSSPLYLLNALIYRSEQQNRLSFLGRTAFDSRSTAALQEQYGAVSRELENLLSLAAEETGMPEIAENFSLNLGLQ